jgi:hypothetical protein
VADVKNGSFFAGMKMFGDYAAVEQGHFPAGKRHQARVQAEMFFV